MPNFLTKKVAGLPVGVWLLIIAAGIGVGLWIRRRAVDPIEDDVEAVDGLEDDAGVVPAEYLPSEDPGYFPITGGGFPVSGSSAIRIEGPAKPIRIIIRQRGGKKGRKGKKGGKKGGVQRNTYVGNLGGRPVRR